MMIVDGPERAPEGTLPTTTTASPPNSQSEFQCGTCHKSYKRVDHLARHVRSHTQSKPYKCRVCQRAFGRADLLKRHMSCHEHDASRGHPGPRISTLASNVSRVSAACRACSSAHLRCTESKPCRRCQGRGIECVPTSQTEPVRPPPPTSPSIDTASQHLLSAQDTLTSPQLPTSTSFVTAIEDAAPAATLPLQGPDTTLMPGQEQSTENISPATAYINAFPDTDMLPGHWTPLGGLHFDLMTSSDLDDIDLRFLNSYSQNVPFEFGSESIRSQETPKDDSSGRSQAATVRSNAFRNSHWRFRPNARDHGGAEEHNLSLPVDTGDHPSPESRVVLGKRIIASRLGVVARDKLLAVVVDNCRAENLSKVVASFPSLELLDTLIQFYLSSPVARSDSFLHVASLDLGASRAELLAAMVAAGAVLTSDSSLAKLGCAIQECIRTAVPKCWERDNSTTRDLELSQAWMISLETALWSGQSRKVEIAESSLQPLLTMLRRNSKFRQSGYSDVSVQLSDGSDITSQKWKTWIHQESFRRLAFRLLQHDTDSSMALLVNPLVSYAEVTVSLPCANIMWTASSPEAWRSHHLTNGHASLFLPDCLDDPEIISTGIATVDTVATSLAYLSCAWRLVWECRQLISLRKRRPQRENGFLMSCRQEELAKMLKQFRICMDPSMPAALDITVRLEAVHLHAFTLFEDIQIFAGMEGPEQVETITPTISHWTASEEARKAVWHAGQIFRTAKLLPRSRIQGPIAVILYQASLVLWTYGMLTSDSQSTSTIGQQAISTGPDHAIWLDENDDLSLQRFIQFGRGSPSISMPVRSSNTSIGNQSQVVLYQPDKVLEAVIMVLRANHGESKPLLIDNLVQLMEALQGSSARRCQGIDTG